MTGKELFIADTTITIKDTETSPIKEGMVEKLDEMLNEYGITHFFTLPIDSTDGIANNDEDCLNLWYDKKDELKVELIYALWGITTRHTEEWRIRKALARIGAA